MAFPDALQTELQIPLNKGYEAPGLLWVFKEKENGFPSMQDWK